MKDDVISRQAAMSDLVSRSYLLAEYDRQHQGPPGGARKIIEEAPSIETEIIFCKDCRHFNPFLSIDEMYHWDGYCTKWKYAHTCRGWFCSRAERRTDE